MGFIEDILAIVWIILGLTAVIFICFLWITWSRLPSKGDWIHAFVASFLSSRFVFCGLVLFTVAVINLRGNPWSRAECQLAFWAATTSCLSDILTTVAALTWACTQLALSCATKASTTRVVTDIVVAMVWVTATLISGLVVLLYGSDQIVDDEDATCWMLPVPAEKSLSTSFLLFYFICGVLITILASSVALRSTFYNRDASSGEGHGEAPPGGDAGRVEGRPRRPSCVPPLALGKEKEEFMDSGQRSMMLSVLASLTAFLNTIPHCVILGIGLLQKHSVPHGSDIQMAAGLVHALSLPVGLCLASPHYRYTLASVLREASDSVTNRSSTQGSSQRTVSRTTIAHRGDCSQDVPDIVVTGPTPPQTANIHTQHANNAGQSARQVSPHLHQRISASICRSVSSATVHVTRAKKVLVKRSQSNQTRREWMRMMRDAFLPNIKVNTRQPKDTVTPSRTNTNQTQAYSNPVLEGAPSDITETDDFVYDDADIDEVLDGLDDDIIDKVEMWDEEHGTNIKQEMGIQNNLNKYTHKCEVNLGSHFEGSVQSIPSSGDPEGNINSSYLPDICEEGNVLNTSDKEINVNLGSCCEEEVLEGDTDSPEVSPVTSNPFSTEWTYAAMNRHRHSGGSRHSAGSRHFVTSSSSSEESEIVTITVKGRKTGSRRRRKLARNPFMKQRSQSISPVPGSVSQHASTYYDFLPPAGSTNPFLGSDSQTSLVTSDDSLTNPFIQSGDDTTLSLSLEDSNPFWNLLESAENSISITSSNPFLTGDFSTSRHSKKETNHVIETMRDTRRPRREVSGRRGRVRRAWRSAAMAISIVDLLRSKSERLAVLDNGQRVESTRVLNPFLDGFQGAEENNEMSGTSHAAYKTDYI